MDNRTLRSKRSRPRSAGPYDRQNQSILGKVCSTVKGLLNPSSWFNVSQWYGNSEEETPGCSTNVEDTVREDNDIVSQSVSHGSKRLRLRVEDRVPSIQSSATQTWSEQPTTNLYESSVSHVPSSTTQNPLLDNKETLPVLNGDDHSENSEGSASTSGCSSLVSSHKDNNRLVDSPFQNIRSDMRNSRNRREASTSKSGDLSSRSLWSSNFSPSAKFQRRLPTISNTNQPNFNLSSFVGPSKFNQSTEKKVLSPFYEGKTTFGGASAVRRMPSSVAPYQVEKTLRNQIKVREQHSEDNLEGMSSAAKRILLTLEKMSSPVTDAKKMPNTSTSPVDLSLYLTPPKSRRNAQFTPSIPSKGPPIANITTIAKLANLKNYGVNRLRNTMLSSPVLPAEQKNTNLDIIQPSTSDTNTSKGGGGKMRRNKLNQHHQSTKNVAENEILEELSLPNIPLPISTLPIITFGQKQEKKVDNFLSSKGFTFSNPIQPDLSISNEVATSPRTLSTSSYDSKIETNSDLQLKPFVFSSPIEHELPSNRILPTENTSLLTCNTSNSDIRMTSTSKDSGFLPKITMNNAANSDSKPSSTWECTECWVRNPNSRTTCMGCKPSQVPKKDNSTAAGFKFNNTEKPQQGSPSVSTSCTGFLFGTPQTGIESVSSRPLSHGSGSNNSPSTWECSVCWVRNPEKPSKCIACGVPRFQNEKLEIKSPASSSSTNTTTTWECSSCWVRNSEKDSKCVACEVPRGTKETGLISSSAVTSSASLWECSSCWVRNPMEKSKCMACETARPSKKGISGPKTQEKIAVSNASSTWECSSCWVRNPMKEKKCLACETLHPSKDAASGLKDANGFKFSSPIHNSPITFKFGNFVCTVQSTNTTSTLKFGTATNTSSETTTTTSGFKFGVPLNSGTSTPVTTTTSNFKFGLPLTSVDNASSQAVTTSAGFKFGVPLSCATGTSSSAVTTTTNSFSTPLSSAASTPSLVATTLSSIFGASSSTSSPFCSSVASTDSGKTSDVLSSNSTGFKAPNIPFGSSENKQTEQSSVSETALSGSKLICMKQNKTVELPSEPSKRSCQHSVSDSVISNAPETTISKEKEVAPPSVTACFGFTTQPVLDSKKSSGGFSVETTKEKSSSNILSFTSTVFPISTSKDKISDNRKSVLSESKDKSLGAENKLSPAFQLTSQSQSVSSAFSLPSTAAPVLKFGEKTDSSKTNASSTSVALTTTTTSTFSFSNNNSNFGSITSAKASEIPSISSGLQPAIKSEDAKIPTSTTSAVFAFGNSAVTTSAPSAFSFFPSSSASSTPASSVFTFGASSNAATSKPGGFTFKNLDKPQNAQTLPSASTAQGLNIGASASAPSGGFVFGAPKTEAQSAASTPFVFGSGATSSANTTAFSAFQPSQPANPAPTFQFGSQPSGSTAPTFGSSNTFTFGKSETSNQISSSLSQNPASAFGSSTTSNFAFGQKNETPNQIPSTVSQAPTLAFGSTSNTFSFSNKNENSNTVSQNPAPVFGSSTIQATFGNTSVPSFGGSDKPASGGFNFGVSTSGVFQFGGSNPEKKPAVQPAGFSFGTPAASENNSFSTGFNMNTPPSFNFGATSTPTAPFQFVASTFEGTSGQSAPRKYRKAVRRVIRKD